MYGFMSPSAFGPQSTLLVGANTSNVMGAAAASAPASLSGGSFMDFAGSAGGAMSIAGAVSSAVGAWYGAKSAKSAASHAAAMARGQMEMQKTAVKQAELTRSQQVLATEYQMSTQKLSLGYQATLGEVNARISELGARSMLLQGERQEQAQRISTAQLKGAQRVAMAANGVDLGSVSAINIQTGTDVAGEIDANTIRANALRSAWGYRAQALNSENQAALARAMADNIDPDQADVFVSPYAVDPSLLQPDMSGYYEASSSAISPVGSAAQSLVGSALGVADKWYAYQKLRV